MEEWHGTGQGQVPATRSCCSLPVLLPHVIAHTLSSRRLVGSFSF